MNKAIIGLVLGIMLVGCAQPPPKPKLVPVGGRVEYKGKPIGGTGVTIQFAPFDNPLAESSMGQLDAEGKFTLASPNFGPGATPGRYKVSIMYYGNPGPIPPQFQDPSKTPLMVEVPESGKTDFVLKLE